MVHVIDISDPADPRLDDFRDLNSSDRRPDLPEGKGLVIAEGVFVTQRLLTSRFEPISLLASNDGSWSSLTISTVWTCRSTVRAPK